MTEHLKQLAKAATQGPWGVVDGHYPCFKELTGASFKVSVVMWSTDLTDADSQRRSADLSYIAAASPDVILALITEHEEQSRLLGMSGSREADLIAEISRLTQQCKLFDAATYKAQIEAQTLVEAANAERDDLRIKLMAECCKAVDREKADEALMREALNALRIRDVRLHDAAADKLLARMGMR
jgi:hypothetical protein